MANFGFEKADSACVREARDGERRVMRDTEPALLVNYPKEGKEEQTSSSSSGDGDVAELIELALVIDGTNDSVCYLLVHIQEFSKQRTGVRKRACECVCAGQSANSCVCGVRETHPPLRVF